MEKNRDVMRKSPALYITMLSIWTALTILLWTNFLPRIVNAPFVDGITPSVAVAIMGRILLFFNGIFISYFWLNGVKDFIYVVWYYVFRKRMFRRYYEVMDTDVSNATDKVLMAYCTCNDFDGYSLEESMKQSYPYITTVILDDSTDEEYKKKVDEFASLHGLEVVRRGTRTGFKAGNINHYFQSEECKRKGYGYYVILDSDEILPTNYVYESLKYFYARSNVGIVQANHVSDRNRNFFMKLFHVGVNSHWPTYQTMKHFYGFSTMLGHGAMIKRECYEKTGGFPPLVAEDLCLSIEARNVGYMVAFAPNIVCREEYPVDYVAFKKRHSKWTQGNLEFIKKYSGKIARSKMKWFEKMDIVLFTYNLPLTAVFAFFIFVNLTVAPLLRLDLGAAYALWMIIPTVVFFFSPMLNDFVTWAFRLNPLRTLVYTFSVVILYGSMLTTSLVSAGLGIFGKKAKFIVTPKSSRRVGILFALRFQWKELVFSTFLLIVSLIFQGGVLPVLLIVATGYFSLILLFFSNIRYTKEETEAVDRQTMGITLRLNHLYSYGARVKKVERVRKS
ncbi:MAG: glycosyltransferase family 2 protein [Clostridia bacterium]|nr:glycosyltransferase family 2 protein [Clostridia bacterium]